VTNVLMVKSAVQGTGWHSGNSKKTSSLHNNTLLPVHQYYSSKSFFHGMETSNTAVKRDVIYNTA
jgi:hypothetical protein